MQQEHDPVEQDVAEGRVDLEMTETVPHFFSKNVPTPGDALSESATDRHHAGSASGDSQSSIGIWDRFLARGVATSESGFGDGGSPASCWTAVTDTSRSFLRDLRRKAVVTVQHPDIWLSGLFVLLVLLGVSVGTLVAWSEEAKNTMRVNAQGMAEEVSTAMSHRLDVVLVPLLTMRNYVKQLSGFRELSSLVGERGVAGSAPAADGAKGLSHRNLTKFFDKAVTDLFNEIAHDIRSTNGFDDIVMNIQLAPKAAVSMIYPLKETKVLTNGKVIVQDNTGAIGHDLLNDPNRVAIAIATVPAPGVVTAGPLNLVQGGVVKSLIARLPINFPGQSMTVLGKNYECWGFAVVILNWEQLIEQVGIYQRFESAGMLFSLTRTDSVKQTDGTFKDKVSIIAESEAITASGGNVTLPDDKLTFALNTTNNEWVMAVGYPHGFTVDWLPWSLALVIVGSVVVTILIIVALVNRKEHQLLLYRMMPRKAIAKLQKGESVIEKYDQVTIFFSDIIGFTSMAGEMTPIQVMGMLNELYTIFDDLVEKYDVYKVETIGDAYMVLGGAPNVCPPSEGAEKTAKFALAALQAVRDFRKEDGTRVLIRCGLASGPVVAGVVGRAMPRYCLFGDTVNFASRMESNSSRMKIQVAELTYFLLKNSNTNFKMTPRIGKDGRHGIQIKGKGRINTYWVEGIEGEMFMRASSSAVEEAAPPSATGPIEVVLEGEEPPPPPAAGTGMVARISRAIVRTLSGEIAAEGRPLATEGSRNTRGPAAEEPAEEHAWASGFKEPAPWYNAPESPMSSRLVPGDVPPAFGQNGPASGPVAHTWGHEEST